MTPPPSDNSRKAPSPQAIQWRGEAEAAAEAGDWPRAIVCYRRALELSPFSQNLRADFEWAVAQQVAASKPKTRRPRAASPEPARVVPVAEETPESTPARRPARAPRRAAPPPTWRRIAPYALAVFAAVVVTGGAVALSAGLTQKLGEWTSSEQVALPPPLPEDLKASLASAQEHLTAKRNTKAVDQLRTALKDHPEHEDVVAPGLELALRAHGAAERLATRHESAAKAYREATELRPENARNWADLGHALRDVARTNAVAKSTSRKREVLEEAARAYETALKLEPGEPESLYGIAQVYSAKNDRQKAADAFEKVVALAPKSREGQMAVKSLAELKKK